MSILFNPTGSLNVAVEPSDLPQDVGEGVVVSGAMVRCKNLRTNEIGKAITRDGSAKINASAINTDVWLIEEQQGSRYTFAGTAIYLSESSIETGLTNASWSAIKYNAFNDAAQNIFALNGTDRKRIQGSSVYEWGLAPPSFAPTISAGLGTGLTGLYNVKYTYVRKVGSVVVAESNPSPAATIPASLTDKSLSIAVTEPTDAQVTHVRMYRTFANGGEYFLDTEISAGGYGYGYSYSWESGYIDGTGYKFTATNSATGEGVSISSQTLIAPPSGASTCGYTLGSDGVAYTMNAGVDTPVESEWLLSGNVVDYEARATVTGGIGQIGTFDSWLPLTTSRSWELISSGGVLVSEFLVEIREVGTTEILASAVISLEVEGV